MDVRSMLAQLDALYGKGDLKTAETCLDRWLEEAFEQRSWGAVLTIYNEMEGLYRTTGRADKAAGISDDALDLIEKLGLCNTIHHATTLQNGATANRVAGNMRKALNLYRQAAQIYTSTGAVKSYQMASLYNNISHIYQHFNEHDKALEYLKQALELVSSETDSEAEIATTYTGMALSYMAINDLENAENCISKAMGYYNSDSGSTDGHRGSALSAVGELYWHKKDYVKALYAFERALEFTLKVFGENDGCRVIRQNIELIKKDMQTEL